MQLNPLKWFNKSYVFQWYIDQRTRFHKGRGEVAIFINLFEIYIFVDLWLVVKMGLKIPWYVTALGGVVLFFVWWGIGYLYDITGAFLLESETSNKRNLMYLDMRKKLFSGRYDRECKKYLKKIKNEYVAERVK